MYAGGLMSPMHRCFSDLVCHPLVASYVINAYLCLAMLHAWIRVPAHDALRLTVDILAKAERQWPMEKTTGSPFQRLAIHVQGLGGCQRSTAAIYAVES